MGIWSCLGTTIEDVKNSLYEGKSGIGLEKERLEYGYQSCLTGIVEQPKLKGLIDRHMRRGFSEEAEYAYMASRQLAVSLVMTRRQSLLLSLQR